MNGRYAKRSHIPKSPDHDTPNTANKDLRKKAPIRHNRSIDKPGHAVHVKKEKEHKYLLSKGPVSLLEEEPEINRAGSDEHIPETQQSDDVEQAEENPEKKEKKDNNEEKGIHS
jgi:hypothetical protein